MLFMLHCSCCLEYLLLISNGRHHQQQEVVELKLMIRRISESLLLRIRMMLGTMVLVTLVVFFLLHFILFQLVLVLFLFATRTVRCWDGVS